jgi:hypothetical protein
MARVDDQTDNSIGLHSASAQAAIKGINIAGKRSKGPKSNKNTANIMRKKNSQPTDRHHKLETTLFQGRACLPQATPAAPQPWQATARKIVTHNPESLQGQHLPPHSLGKQQRTRLLHITLNLCKSRTQFRVDTSVKRSLIDSGRPRRRYIAQGTNVRDGFAGDGFAGVSLRLNARRHQSVTGVQMSSVVQGGSGAMRSGCGGNAGRAVRLNHEDIQQAGTMGWGRGHLHVSSHCNNNGTVPGLSSRIAACASREPPSSDGGAASGSCL